MKSYKQLPEGYSEIYSLDLKKDKKRMLLVNGLAIVIAAAMAVPAAFAVPFSKLFDMEQGILMYLMRFITLIFGSFLYIILHELVHGIAMKICGTEKVKYGFTGAYAFAGSDEYYDKKSYIFIALAPVVLWGIVLAVINMLVPISWFWVIYIIQMTNIGGAAGDFYVTCLFLRLPRDIIITDYGVGMKVYLKK